MNNGKNLILFTFLLFLTSTIFSASVELEEGWNTFSVDSTLDESELISSNSCDFRSVQGTDNYFFIQDSEGDYSEVSTLYPWNAYYGWVSEACTLQTDSSEWSNTVDLTEGSWNLIRPPENIGSVESDCGVSQGSLEFMYYTEYGGDITGLALDDALFSENRGIFVYPTDSCSITYSSDDDGHDDVDDGIEDPDFEEYLKFDEVVTSQSTISGDSETVDVTFSFERESVETHGVDAEVGLIVDDDRLKTESFSDTEESQQISLSWEELWTGDSENVDLGIVLDSSSEGNYQWDVDERDLGSIELERCSEDYAYSEYNDECVVKNTDLDIDSIEQNTNWAVRTEQNTVHKMDSIEASSEDHIHELSLNTWRDNENNDGGYCGSIYFETHSLEAGDIVVEATQNELDDGNQYSSQSPQEPFIEIAGDRIFEDEIAVGETETIEETVGSDDSVRIGIEDTSLGCNQYTRRTHLDFSITESSRQSCSELGYNSCQDRDDCYYSNEFNQCISN